MPKNNLKMRKRETILSRRYESCGRGSSISRLESSEILKTEDSQHPSSRSRLQNRINCKKPFLWLTLDSSSSNQPKRPGMIQLGSKPVKKHEPTTGRSFYGDNSGIFTNSFYAETSRNYQNQDSNTSQTNNSFIDATPKAPKMNLDGIRATYEPRITSVDRQNFLKNEDFLKRISGILKVKQQSPASKINANPNTNANVFENKGLYQSHYRTVQDNFITNINNNKASLNNTAHEFHHTPKKTDPSFPIVQKYLKRKYSNGYFKPLISTTAPTNPSIANIINRGQYTPTSTSRLAQNIQNINIQKTPNNQKMKNETNLNLRNFQFPNSQKNTINISGLSGVEQSFGTIYNNENEKKKLLELEDSGQKST